eukprot:TRINITY_DN598_c0_g1_i6.p1 TRINITY_DN598_c0_g1~~TRINITY_DN598_c0_g1_i6.p1  ORF type:complete len:286 (+),score=43.56 TRINITY_DN598_c0_g1_i6:85-942(+)
MCIRDRLKVMLQPAIKSILEGKAYQEVLNNYPIFIQKFLQEFSYKANKPKTNDAKRRHIFRLLLGGTNIEKDQNYKKYFGKTRQYIPEEIKNFMLQQSKQESQRQQNQGLCNDIGNSKPSDHVNSKKKDKTVSELLNYSMKFVKYVFSFESFRNDYQRSYHRFQQKDLKDRDADISTFLQSIEKLINKAKEILNRNNINGKNANKFEELVMENIKFNKDRTTDVEESLMALLPNLFKLRMRIPWSTNQINGCLGYAKTLPKEALGKKALGKKALAKKAFNVTQEQ